LTFALNGQSPAETCLLATAAGLFWSLARFLENEYEPVSFEKVEM
jgi:hypothetical protein